MASLFLWVGLTLLVAVPVFFDNQVVKMVGAVLMIVGSVLLLLGK